MKHILNSLEIKLWNQTVGYLAYNNQKISFEYEDSFKNQD